MSCVVCRVSCVVRRVSCVVRRVSCVVRRVSCVLCWYELTACSPWSAGVTKTNDLPVLRNSRDKCWRCIK